MYINMSMSQFKSGKYSEKMKCLRFHVLFRTGPAVKTTTNYMILYSK